MDAVQGTSNSWVFLANAFVDLGTWNCFTPFVGVGIGGAYNMISNFTDLRQMLGVRRNRQFIRPRTEWHQQWSLAWALYAGVVLCGEQELQHRSNLSLP